MLYHKTKQALRSRRLHPALLLLSVTLLIVFVHGTFKEWSPESESESLTDSSASTTSGASSTSSSTDTGTNAVSVSSRKMRNRFTHTSSTFTTPSKNTNAITNNAISTSDKITTTSALLDLTKSWKRSHPIWNSSAQAITATPQTAQTTAELNVYENKPENLVLYKAFGDATSGYHRRNFIITQKLLSIKSRRIFEFAGNGGFLPRNTLCDKDYNTYIEHWVHSDYSRPTLQYADYMFRNFDKICDMSLDIDAAIPLDWKMELPLTVILPNKISTVAVEVFSIDMSNPVSLTTMIDFDSFDTFITISFEHIKEDLAFISILQPGTYFIFGVPTFDNAEHCRYFPLASDIYKRYGKLMEIESITIVPHGILNNKKYVVVGQRRSQSDEDAYVCPYATNLFENFYFVAMLGLLVVLASVGVGISLGVKKKMWFNDRCHSGWFGLLWSERKGSVDVDNEQSEKLVNSGLNGRFYC